MIPAATSTPSSPSSTVFSTMDNDSTAAGAVDDRQHAPWLPIPSRAVSVVEHPCIVKNVDKGIASLGGPIKLSKGLRAQLETTTNAAGDDELKKLISVSLRPDDPFAKRLLSTPVRTNNLLLKITVPKKTGRKRKRASSGPFRLDHELRAHHGASSNSPTPDKSPHVSASAIYRSVQDNPSKYNVALAGVVDETHRFRSMPDLQYSASYNDTMTALRDHVLPAQYSKLIKYNLNTEAGPDLTRSVGPSAEFLQMPVAFNYRYQQNSYVKYTDQGVINLQKSIAYNAYTIIKPTEADVPTGPKANLPPEESLTPYLQTLVQQIRDQLKKRPIITRHLLYNKLGWDKRSKLRQAAVYCGYFFETGPWREALISWGVDPRKDPQYRKYQTVSFLSYLKTGGTKDYKYYSQNILQLSQLPVEELETEHTFDGVHISRTGNLFQFCDITDPLIARVLATEDIRATCAPTFQGWYHVGTWAKATVILKDKMNCIIRNETPNDAIYQRIVGWPELWDDREIAATYKREINDRAAYGDKRKEHQVMHQVRWAARNPRYTFEMMEASKEQETETETTGGMEDVDIPEDMTENPVTVQQILDDENGTDDNEDEEADEPGEEDDEDENSEVENVQANSKVPPGAVSHGPAPFGGLYKTAPQQKQT